MSSKSDASDILDEILEDSKKPEAQPEAQPEPETKSEKKPFSPEEKPTRKLILIGVKPLVTYVNSTLTQLSTLPTVTIKARGQRITQAVDVSQFIMKRMHSIGYRISDVRISSDALESRAVSYTHLRAHET